MINDAIFYRTQGLQTLPASADKRPLGNWRDLQHSLLSEAELSARFEQYSRSTPIAAIGFLTGKVSGGLEVIDVDSKYDLTGNLYDELKRLIDDNLSEVADSLVIGVTRSKGYHIYYRCEDIAGNQKLARRPTTSDELSTNPNERVKVLIETRGEGGFIVAPPTPGYQLLQGGFDSIPVLAPEQRAILLSIARSFNEEPEVETHQPVVTPRQPSDSDSVSPFADYNQRGDVVSLLERHGWKFVGRHGQRIHLKRPGDSTTKTSGNFHEAHRKLYVFSSSTQFDPEKAYSPADVYMLLECNNDKSEAARQLKAAGYGTPGPVREPSRQVATTSVRVEASDGNGENTILSQEGLLTEDAIRSVVMEGAYLYYTSQSAKLEILQALELVERTSKVSVYLVEVADLAAPNAEPLHTLRPYEFRAQDIMERYAQAYDVNDGYVSPEAEDEFINEFVSTGLSLTDPFNRDRFRALFLLFSERNELGITADTIAAKMDRLRYDQQREDQSKQLTQLIDQTKQLQHKGDVSRALTGLIDKSRELRLLDKAEAFAKYSKISSEEEVKRRIQSRPKPLESGFMLDREPLLIPAAAISIIAGQTSHGKSVMLANLLLNLADNYPDKTFHLFSYEVDEERYLFNLLNAYIGDDHLALNNRQSIEHYFRGEMVIRRQSGQTFPLFDQHKQSIFDSKRTLFFHDLIDSGRVKVHYVTEDSDTLVDAIRHLSKTEPLGAVLIDYFQLIYTPIGKMRNPSRQEELKQICMDFKDLVIETGLPLIFAAQFNREVTNLTQMHATKLGEAGDLERISDLIIGIWNNSRKWGKLTDSEKNVISEKLGVQFATKKGEEDESPDPNTWYVEALKRRGGKVEVWDIWDYSPNAAKITSR